MLSFPNASYSSHSLHIVGSYIEPSTSNWSELLIGSPYAWEFHISFESFAFPGWEPGIIRTSPFIPFYCSVNFAAMVAGCQDCQFIKMPQLFSLWVCFISHSEAYETHSQLTFILCSSCTCSVRWPAVLHQAHITYPVRKKAYPYNADPQNTHSIIASQPLHGQEFHGSAYQPPTQTFSYKLIPSMRVGGA